MGSVAVVVVVAVDDVVVVVGRRVLVVVLLEVVELVVEGRVVALRDVEAIATLPSKEELISKVMFLLNAQAQRLATVLSAVPRNLAIVVKQIGEQKSA